MNLVELRMKLVENWRGWCLCVHVGICQTDKSKAKSKGLEVDLKVTGRSQSVGSGPGRDKAELIRRNEISR